MSTKPILFNTDMVRAILEGRKTVTRRVVKPQLVECPALKMCNDDIWRIEWWNVNEFHSTKVPYCIGDILYVRETWCVQSARRFDADARIMFKAGGDMARIQFPGGGTQYHSRTKYDAFVRKWADDRWHPSIHMPREAARIFLRVTDVRVERLQDITDEQALREGVPEDTDYPLDSQTYCPVCKGVGLVGTLHPVSFGYMEVDCTHCDTPTKRFSNFWDRTIKPADHALYGWQANPWVWVIEFERCEMLKGA